MTSENAEGLFSGEREGLAVVSIAGIQVRVPFEDITLLPEEDDSFIEIHPEEDSGRTKVPYAERNDTIDLHIELLNPSLRHAEPAQILVHQLSRLRAFIDKAIAQHLGRVTVIHGRGEGVLRLEVLKYLDSVSHVRRIEEASHGGAVVVYFN